MGNDGCCFMVDERFIQRHEALPSGRIEEAVHGWNRLFLEAEEARAV